MRYFQNMTQMEIAHELGVSQVQVSRMEKRILRSLQESAEKNKESHEKCCCFLMAPLMGSRFSQTAAFYEKVHFCIWKVLKKDHTDHTG